MSESAITLAELPSMLGRRRQRERVQVFRMDPYLKAMDEFLEP